MYWIGTSGYNYAEWKGSFYPPRLPKSQMLDFYVQHFASVEINYTFYRMPNPQTLENWSGTAPERFRFSLKAPKQITHYARLRDCEEPLNRFFEISRFLGEKTGVLLFQLPPNFAKDLDLFDRFLDLIKPGIRAAFEFRETSWLEDDIFSRLQTRNLALCIADSETMSTPAIATADYAYLRLRDESYTDSDIARWGEVITQLHQRAKEVFVYFKHEETGVGPRFAKQLIELLKVS